MSQSDDFFSRVPQIYTFTNSNDKYFGPKRLRKFEKKFAQCSNSFFL